MGLMQEPYYSEHTGEEFDEAVENGQRVLNAEEQVEQNRRDIEGLRGLVSTNGSNIEKIAGYMGIDEMDEPGGPVGPVVPPTGEWPKEVETTVSFYSIKDFGEAGTAMLRPGSENEVSVGGWNKTDGRHYYMNIPSGAKSVTFNTRVAGQSSKIYDTTGTEVTGTFFPICCFVDDDGLLVEMKAYTRKSELPTAVEFRSFAYDVPAGATGLYINAWMINGNNNTAINATFARTVDVDDEYEIALSDSRKRANYIGVSNGGKWADTENYYHMALSEVVPGAKYSVSANSENRALIAFLTSRTVSVGEYAAFCAGEPGLRETPAATSRSFVAPADAKYLYVYCYVSDKSKPVMIRETIGDFEAEADEDPIEKPEVDGSGSRLVDAVNYNSADLKILREAMEKLRGRVSVLEQGGGGAAGGGTVTETGGEALNMTLSMFKNVAVIGASWDSGWIYEKDGVTPNSATGDRRDLSWLNNLARMRGFTPHNYATHSYWTSPFVKGHGTDKYTMTQMFASGAPKYDLVIITLGGNDAKYGRVGYEANDSVTAQTMASQTEKFIGSVADIHDGDPGSNADSFCGNYGRIVEAVKANNAKAKIVIVGSSAGEMRGKFWAAQQAIAEHYGIPCLKWADDKWYAEMVNGGEKLGSHPSAALCSATGLALERLLSKNYAENTSYWIDYLGNSF